MSRNLYALQVGAIRRVPYDVCRSQISGMDIDISVMVFLCYYHTLTASTKQTTNQQAFELSITSNYLDYFLSELQIVEIIHHV